MRAGNLPSGRERRPVRCAGGLREQPLRRSRGCGAGRMYERRQGLVLHQQHELRVGELLAAGHMQLSQVSMQTHTAKILLFAICLLSAACNKRSDGNASPNPGESSSSSDAIDACAGLDIAFDGVNKDCGVLKPCPAIDCKAACGGAQLVISNQIGKNLASTGLCVKDRGCITQLDCNEVCTAPALSLPDAGQP